MKTWQEWIDYATGKGWKVAWREELQGYVYITPKAYRRPPEELGHFTNQRDAQKAAAFACFKRGD
jgi:hypothetical protein